MKSILLSTNGKKSEIELTSFTQAQDLVNGLVQLINHGTETILVNEEGLVLDLPTNPFLPQLRGNVLIANTKLFNKLSYSK
jgi:hypothetical protein